MMRADPAATAAPRDVAALWLHETARVFGDRLADAADRAWLRARQAAELEARFGLTWADAVAGDDAGSGSSGDANAGGDGGCPLYADFIAAPGSGEPGPYTRAPGGAPALTALLAAQLEEYNAEAAAALPMASASAAAAAGGASSSGPAAPMRLVMFPDAAEHVARVARQVGALISFALHALVLSSPAVAANIWLPKKPTLLNNHTNRVLRLPQGHALLLGVGGSGRRSLARLAAFVCGHEVATTATGGAGAGAAGGAANAFAEWRDDLRRAVKRAGVDGRDVALLLADSQLADDAVLEDVAALLAAGDVPGLMRQEDLDEIANALRPAMAAAGAGAGVGGAGASAAPPAPLPAAHAFAGGGGGGGAAAVQAFFADRVRARLHLVLCLSPADPSFRARLMAFPALVDCTAIDWYRCAFGLEGGWGRGGGSTLPLLGQMMHLGSRSRLKTWGPLASLSREWPEDALEGVARSLLAAADLGGGDVGGEGGADAGASAAVGALAACCVAVHRSVEARSARYYEELRR